MFCTFIRKIVLVCHISQLHHQPKVKSMHPCRCPWVLRLGARRNSASELMCQQHMGKGVAGRILGMPSPFCSSIGPWVLNDFYWGESTKTWDSLAAWWVNMSTVCDACRLVSPFGSFGNGQISQRWTIPRKTFGDVFAQCFCCIWGQNYKGYNGCLFHVFFCDKNMQQTAYSLTVAWRFALH